MVLVLKEYNLGKLLSALSNDQFQVCLGWSGYGSNTPMGLYCVWTEGELVGFFQESAQDGRRSQEKAVVHGEEDDIL